MSTRPPFTPRKPPPFVPTVSPNRQRSLSPPPNLDTGVNSTPMPGASGNFLIVRNILQEGRRGFINPVNAANKALEEIIATEKWAELAHIPLAVTRGGASGDLHCSSVYLELTQEIREFDTVPRPDLLQQWKLALTDARPGWDIAWALMKKGKDKRLSVRFRVEETKKAVDEEAIEKARKYLDAKGHLTTGGFISHNGYIQINFASTLSVDAITSLGSYVITPLHRDRELSAVTVKHIPIESPFELCVSGIGDWEGIHATIEKWIYHRYLYTESGNSRIVSTRISSDREHFIFLMDSWESTAAVLRDAEAFKLYFSKYESIIEPRMIFEVNNTGVFRQSTRTVVEAGVGVVNSALSEMKKELNEIKRSQDANAALVQQQMTVLSNQLASHTAAIGTIGQQLQSFGLSLLAGRDERMLESKLDKIDSDIKNEELCLRLLTDPDAVREAKERILALSLQRRELSDRLSKATERTLSLMGPTPGAIMTSPSVNASAPMQPAINPQVAPSSPPGLPPPSRDRPPHLNDPETPTPTSKSALKQKGDTEDPFQETGTKRRKIHPYNTSDRTLRPRGNTSSSQLSTVTGAPSPMEEDEDELIPDSQEYSQAHGQPVEEHGDDVSIPTHYQKTCSVLTVTCADSVDLNHLGSRPTRDVEKKRRAYKPIDENRAGHTHSYPLIARSAACHTYPTAQPCFPKWLLLVMLFICCVGATSAFPNASGSMSVYALNANGLVNPGKVAAVNRAIATRSPDIVVLSETKTNSKTSSNLAYKDYQFFEEPGVLMTNHHLYKWGLVVGIKNGIAVTQRVATPHASLKGRLLAIDIVIAMDDGRGFSHRIIGAYAPWDPGSDADTRQFWTEAAKICNDAQHSWTLMGDLNATVISGERASGGQEARAHFLKFLRETDGHDLWSDLPERSRLHEWTCRSWLSKDSGSIIDRVVTSRTGFTDCEINVADKGYDFIPMTDHRAVTARIILKSPGNNQARCLHKVERACNLAPRIKFPSTSEKYLFQAFRDEVDRKIEETGMRGQLVVDDDSFVQRYHSLNKIMNETAEEVFGRIKRVTTDFRKEITNPKIQELLTLIRRLGGALRIEGNPQMPRMSTSYAAQMTHQKMASDFRTNPSTHPSLHSFIKYKRKLAYRELYKERMAEIYARARKRDTGRITAALLGGSTKQMVHHSDYIPMPTSVNELDGSGTLVSNPEKVKEIHRQYWKKLYDRQPLPVMEKPWLSTKSVTDVRDRVTADPFIWPKPANIADFRALLRKGNARPSPGPDQCEKWCVKSLSDNALNLVLDLHNYEVMHACFPGDVKDMWITMFHKRGLRTDLSNWRGLMLSNFLANSPMTWLNYTLTPYVAAKNILPDTQVATQPGVQTRDQTSYLAGLMSWAKRNKTPVYALKRDQMKGFDYLAPEGFYDAVKAYGLPSSIADLDRASQTNTRCFIRTAHGITEPITVSGVTKQGGPLSPLKSTMTTSLGHRYLSDIAAKLPGALILTTASHARGDPHLPDDNIQLRVTMTEATDDSFIFATKLDALQSLCLTAERFQYAYGWMTQWLKTVAYLIAPSGCHPDEVTMPSITVQDGVSPMVVTHHTVPLIKNELEFLRVKINDATHRYHELRDFIDAFTFPKFIGPTPITLVRKIVAQSIASRARALLSLQPIRDEDAFRLDKQIADKVHRLFGFPWAFNTAIATLPVSMHGFDFPSIRRINAGIAVEGLSRDLNHHIPAYRAMARITFADWTCELNKCCNPLDGTGLGKNFKSRLQYGTIPAAWIIAQQEMGSMSPKMSLRATDQSHIMNGDVSISHMLNSCESHISPVPDGTARRSLRVAGVRQLRDMGEWKVEQNKVLFMIQSDKHSQFRKEKPSKAALRNWESISAVLSQSKIEWLYTGAPDLLLSRLERQRAAETRIVALAEVCKYPASKTATDGKVWGSDGSMIPATSGIGDTKFITAAATGKSTIVLRIDGRNTSILQAEQMGLISTMVMASNNNPLIFTDHRNSVNFVDDSRSSINQDQRLRNMNGRSYYRWIIDLAKRKSAQITYTRGHTTDTSLAARLNREADHYASTAQKVIGSIPYAPIPTFFMNDFTFYREVDGWIESNIRNFVSHFGAQQTADQLDLSCKHRMSSWLYDPTIPPLWIYTKATSAYTALVQLYARSGQLVTASGMLQKKATTNSSCRFGCLAMETPHHIFVKCDRYHEMREGAGEQISRKVEARMEDAGITENNRKRLMNTVTFLFSDSETVWPLHSSAYYLGQIPKLEPLLSTTSMASRVNRSRILHNIATDMHLASVRLASRIYGDLQREMTKRWSGR